MSLVFQPTVGATVQNPQICVDNAIPAGATYSTTGEGAAANVASMETYNFVKIAVGETVQVEGVCNVDYIGIFLHAEGAGFSTVYVKDPVTDTWAEMFTIPHGIGPQAYLFLRPFKAISGIRVLAGTSTLRVINIKAGKRISMPYRLGPGYAPPTLNPQDERLNELSVKGQILGSTLERSGVVENLEFSMLNPSWVDTNLTHLSTKLRTEAMYFAWSPVDKPEDVTYTALEGNVHISYDTSVTQVFSMTTKGPAHGRTD